LEGDFKPKISRFEGMDKLINSEDVVANEINRWILVLMVGVMFT
jgi:hypothetical protein